MYKQVIVVRGDLKLSPGKLAAQAAHASVNSYKRSSAKAREEWEKEGEKKVVLRVDTPEDLLALYNAARNHKLPAALVKDAGRTELPPGTVTALGIGPAKENEIDKITGKLKML